MGIMDRIHIEKIEGPSPEETRVELVERKGLGHPDTICDLVMERVSQALSSAYLEHAGRILHHNCDKGLLVAGQVERRFGGGDVIEPMRLLIGDRATSVTARKRLDVAGIAIETAKGWFRENLPRIDPDHHLRYQAELKPGSDELTGLFGAKTQVLGANDTSAAVGYAPLSETERIVLETERYLNSADFKRSFPEAGEDVKVMGVRTGRKLTLFVAMPLLDRYIHSDTEYFERKETITRILFSYLSGRLQNLNELEVSLNHLDRLGIGMAGMYLSVLGTSAEDADSGEVGRGNQVNGLISLNRPRGSEAAAGKNPVSHVGKIYNVLSHVLANRIYDRVSGLRDIVIWLCSCIGEPIDQPQMVSVQARLNPDAILSDVAKPIQEVISEQFDRMPLFCEELARGCYRIC